MHYVYILKSKIKDIHYVGYSSNPAEIISFHNSSSNTGWTKQYKPWVCIYLEGYQSKTVALKR
jgi:predicted GIY-YIG superfamily endonuclease